MPRRSLVLALAAPLALGACEAGTANDAAAPDPAPPEETAAMANPSPSPTGTDTPPASADADDAACGADKLGRWLNVLPTDDVQAEIAAAVGNRPFRYYGPNDAITMDFNPQRLNGELGEDGRIKRFRCG